MSASNTGRPPPLDLTGLAPPNYGVNGPGGGHLADPTPPGEQRAGANRVGSQEMTRLITHNGTRSLATSTPASVEGMTPAGDLMLMIRHRSGSVTETHHASLASGSASGQHSVYHRDREGNVSYTRPTQGASFQRDHRAAPRR
jgi:hypothetical protein